jgi:kynurenine formamidase
VDIRDKTAADPDYALTGADVLTWEGRHGQVRAGSVVLLYTGWQEKWKDPAAYLNPDASGNLHFPGFGTDAARFLLAERGIAGLGIDTHGVDGGRDTTFGVNAQVLAQGRILAQGTGCPERPRVVLENLANLDRLPPTGATLVIGVLRLRGGSGSPVSVMAFVP